jgi:peroxiredoxin (alkyl hydroperoxide reductase subunit C)
MLSVKEKFPSFNLTGVVSLDPATAFETFTESSCAGKWKIYFFWPLDFSLVCPTEIVAFGAMNHEFTSRNAQVLGASCDSQFVHMAWRESHPGLKALPFPMLSDLKRELSTALGILDPDLGVSQRATFIVDAENIIRFVYATELGIGRDPKEVLRVLDALQTGGMTPCGWQAGEETIKG